MLKVEHIGIAVKNLAIAVPLYEKLLKTNCYKKETVAYENVITAFFKKGNAFLSQVKSTVLVYKASAKLSRLRSETGIGVGFRRRIYPCKRHPLFLRTQGTRFTALFLFHLRNCSTFHTL